MTLTLSTSLANSFVDLVVDSLDGGSPGTVKIYSGSRPATPDDALGGATLLATLTLGNPAFGSSASRAATVNAVASVTAANTGTAAWFRAATSAGTAKFDGSVTATGGGGDLTLNTVSLVSGGTVNVTGGTIASP